MFYTEKAAAESINLDDRRECEEMMDRIYREAPDKWPHGLHMSGFDGGVYMIREASTGKPVGFTGWQEKRAANGKKVGYYSIGILPEYRRNGYAKAAVSQLLVKKAHRVDKVEAFIARDNKPSIGLAEALGVDVVHEAHVKRANKWKSIGTSLGSGLGIGTFMDVLHNAKSSPEEGTNMFEAYADSWKNPTLARVSNLLANIGMGAGGTYALAKGKNDLGIHSLLGIPAKDLAITGTIHLPKYLDTWKSEVSAMRGATSSRNRMALLLSLLGGGALAGGGLLANKYMNQRQEAERERSGGRVRLSLPTKDPNDIETQVDLPMREIMLPEYIRQELSRDTRSRLREEGKERKRQRIGRPKAASEVESLRRIKQLLK